MGAPNTFGSDSAEASLVLMGGVPTTRAINTTSPLTGGGNLSADRTISFGTQVAKTFLAGPAAGADAAPAFRAMALLDLPASARIELVECYISGAIPGVGAVWAAPGTIAAGAAGAKRVKWFVAPGIAGTPTWTLAGVYGYLETAPGGADICNVQVWKATGIAGAFMATTAAFTITGAAVDNSDEAHFPTFTVGDGVALRVQGGGSAADLHLTLAFLRTA